MSKELKKCCLNCFYYEPYYIDWGDCDMKAEWHLLGHTKTFDYDVCKEFTPKIISKNEK